MLVVELGDLALLIHLMSAGRLQLWDKRASLRDRASRLLVRLDDGRELRLREFGTQQRAWAKLLPAERGRGRRDGGHARPRGLPRRRRRSFAELLDQPRHLHPLLRDQRTIAGIGRSWVDEILWTARLSPFQKGSELEPEEVERLGEACDDALRGALDHYEEVIGETVPDKLPMPLAGAPPRRASRARAAAPRIEAIHFKDYVMCYCPRGADGRPGAQGPPPVAAAK